MPKLDRWIVASKSVDVLDAETYRKILAMGAQTAGGWNTVHQHVLVSPSNKEEIESLMKANGLDVRPASDKNFFHPDTLEKELEAGKKAEELCREFCREQFAIQRSFQNLESEIPADLLSDAFVSIAEDRAEEIADNWIQDIRSNRTTSAYRDLGTKRLKDAIVPAIALFSQWLGSKNSNTEVAEHFTQLGQRQREAGLKLHELLSALTLLRKQIFLFAENEGMWDSALGIYKILEFNRRLVIYFDKAAYHAAKGYEC